MAEKTINIKHAQHRSKKKMKTPYESQRSWLKNVEGSFLVFLG